MAYTPEVEAKIRELQEGQKQAYAEYLRLQEQELALRQQEDDRGPAQLLGEPQGYRLLAEGDSWFDYPQIGVGDVISHLRRLQRPGFRVESVRNLAHWGHESVQMMGSGQRKRLLETLRGPELYDAILFSGGGNDIVGEPFMLWLRDYQEGMDPLDGVNAERLDRAIAVVLVAVHEFLDLRDRYREGVPVFLHGYDFAPPNGRPFCAGVGPWLKPGLDARSWGEAPGAIIVREFLKRFDAALREAASLRTRVYIVDTQGTLGPDEWDNELHPKRTGFAKLAGRFADALLKHAPISGAV